MLIFCFYRETARALHRHLRREVGQRILTLTAEKLGLEGAHRLERAEDALTRIARRLSDARSPFHQEVQRNLRAPFASKEFHILMQWEEQLVGLMIAYVRSAPFIARYLPLERPEVRRAFSEDRASHEEVRAGVAALGHALTEHMDGSSLTMAHRLEEFLRFAKELAERARFQSVDDAEDADTRVDPLKQYLDALAVHVRRGGEGDDTDDEDVSGAAEGSWRMQGTVRLVYGETKRAARERLMLAFNSPLFPEVLVSSSVLGEGVDLHRFCRYVIHHDLCWNPSTIEQRTGRLDRIRCKAEVAGRPIVIYEPYLAGSADERMFRVVRDRERWFQVVMGQKFEFDEATAERLANRVPLPEELAAELVFDLRRAKPAGPSLREPGQEMRRGGPLRAT
ncbi:C-terminal helicase domain-containing protein [Archangium sp.]|uniref:C-terminal helicase domain-containing protein n=1 Tax=Archangium sp. TaxID=1872627 RepID=UPI00286CC430|nr:C-terminal helicase domain-containing protein [Archangium sp.]